MFNAIRIAPLVHIKLDLHRYRVDVRPRTSLDCRSLSGASRAVLKKFHEKTGVPESYFDAMITRSDWGYGCFVNDELIAWIWIQWNAVLPMTIFGMNIPALMSDSSEVYLHHVYTLPEHRTWAVWAALTNYVYTDLASRGLKIVHGLIQPSNELSLKLHLERGWAVDKKCVAIGFGGHLGRLIPMAAFVYRLIPRLRALVPSRPRLLRKTWVLDGTDVSTRESLRVLLSTRRRVVPISLLPLFRNEPRILSEGADTERVHFVVWERSWWRPRFLERRFGMAMTDSVALRVPLSVERGRSTARLEEACARLSNRKGWTFTTDSGQDALHRFFYFYYEPSLKKSVPFQQRRASLSQMQADFTNGFLLKLSDGAKTLAMMLVKRDGNALTIAQVGVRSGARELVHQAVFPAMLAYLVGTHRGQQTQIDFVGLSPLMTKRGVLLFGHWPVEVVASRLSTYYWVAPNLCDALAQRALSRLLVCHAPDRGHVATFFYDTKSESRQDRILAIKSKSNFLKGDVRGLPFPPIVRRNPASISFAKHPVAIWPTLCRWMLRFYRWGRALLGGNNLDRFYRESPRWPIERLQQWQEQKLKEVLLHAATTVPHFKALLADYTPSQFSMNWFRTLPFLERHDIAQRPNRYISTAIEPGTTISTSGTSGHPLTIHIALETLRHREAAQRRGREWWGFSAGDRFAKLFGRISPQRWPRRIRERWLENRVLFNAYAVTPAAMFRWYETLCRKSFAYIYGYSSAASELAREWQRRGFFLPTGWIGGVIVTADVISDDQRKNIEHVFGAPTIREYGSTEFHVIAMECPYGGWHLEADRLFIEFLNSAGEPAQPFEPARIVVTALDALRMPFIRYPLTDVGSYSDRPCVCGRTLPLLHSLAGRDVSTLRLPTGGLSHSGLFSVLIEAAHKECDRICPLWQAAQRSSDHVEIFLVEKSPSPNVEEAIRRKMKQVDPLFHVTFSYVDVLPAAPGGKRNRFVELAPL